MTSAFGSVLPQTRDRVERVRAQVDRVLLRLQGRMDHPGVDRFTPWVVAVLLFGVLAALALARNRSIDTLGPDLAAVVQGTWLLGEGFQPEVTLLGRNLLAEQVSLVVYPIAVLLRFTGNRIVVLLVLQAAALALTVVPLWRLARGLGRLRVGVTSAIAFAFCVYAAVHNLNLAGFHPEALALPALVAAARYGLEERRTPYFICVALVLVCRADLGLAIAALGLLLTVEGHRRRGLESLLLGVGWLVVAIFVVQPALAGDLYPHVDAFETFGDSPFSVIGGIFSNPIDFLREVFSEANFRTIVTLLAPVLFLPLVAPRYLLPVVPLYSLYLAADVPVGRLSESAQTIPMTAFIFVATVFALKRSGQILVERVSVDRRVVVALLLTATVFFVRDAASSPYEKPWDWATQRSDDIAILEAVDLVPDNALVRASPRVLPRIAERIGVYELDTTSDTANSLDYAAAVQGVDWIIFDPQAAPNWQSDPLSPQVFQQRLGAEGFARVFDGEVTNDDGSTTRTGVWVFQYGAEFPVDG